MIVYSLIILVLAVVLFFALRRLRFATRLVIAIAFFLVGVAALIACILIVGDEPLPGARTIDLEELRQHQERDTQKPNEKVEEVPVESEEEAPEEKVE
jgi:hypothetical protein